MRSAIPMASSRSTGRDSAARIDGTRAVPRRSADARRRAVVASRPTAVISASPAMQRLTPRQPIQEPTQAASGTPTSSVSDCPLITQPSARPCCVGRTRAETSVNTTPLNRPQQPPASVAQAATARKLPPVATPIVATARPSGPPIRNGRVPQRSDPAPANHRRDAPGDRGDGDQIGDQRHADRQVARHVDQERRARGAAGGHGEHRERGDGQQGPGHALAQCERRGGGLHRHAMLEVPSGSGMRHWCRPSLDVSHSPITGDPPSSSGGMARYAA